MGIGDYSDQQLREAAGAATCMSHFLAILGIPATAASRRSMSDGLKRRGISRAHWVHSPRVLYSREKLEQAVANSLSFAGVLRNLQVRQAGGSQAHIARRIRREGIDTSHFTGQGHNRGKSGRRLSPDELLVLLPRGARRQSGKRLRRAMLERGVPERCDECGITVTWQGRPLTLIVEHKSGDWLDNRLSNLRLLCPNCHSQTATWCRRKPGP
jgi:hypothetical protein